MNDISALFDKGLLYYPLIIIKKNKSRQILLITMGKKYL